MNFRNGKKKKKAHTLEYKDGKEIEVIKVGKGPDYVRSHRLW